MAGATLADDIIDRLKERVDQLQGRVEGAAALMQVLSAGAAPQSPVAAYVVADALRGGTVDAASELFVQGFEETVNVLLIFRSVQGAGGRGLDLYDAVKWAVIEAVCGWAPEDTVGVFRLGQGRTIRQEAGTLYYEIDFAIGDQLRINVT
jgi:hypothetical protein